MSVIRRIGFSATVVCAAALVACGGGGGGGGSSAIPVITPTAFPTSLPSSAPLGTSCLAPGQSAARQAQSVNGQEARFPARRTVNGFAADQLAVNFQPSQMQSAGRTLQSVSGTQVIKDFAYPAIDRATRFVRVDPAQMDGAIAAFKTQPGVMSVERVPMRYLETSTARITNDPYFREPVPTSPPAGYVQPGPPLYESASVPGQWDMHIIGLENAFGYSNASNSLGIAIPAAMGSALVKLAVIDTGMDITLPDIASSRVVHAVCFITPAGSAQTTSNNVSDFDGHGTNVAGIAAGLPDNGFGFVGVGGNVSLMAYRIFPVEPASGCPPGTTDPQCGASLPDEVAAINDAVNNGANVINLSLGSSTPSTAEGNAIASAISRGVVVVAASGNGNSAGVGQPTLDYPANYPNVVAVGASALNDSAPGVPTETIASYSNYAAGSTNWGIVAPGGDATGSSDADFLHWIQNSYSLRATSPCRAASGLTDFFGESGNCSALFNGTSQATPHVAGAVALLLSVKSMNPAQVLAALKASAHPLPGYTDKAGAGRLNVYLLIANALNDPAPPPK